MPHINILLTYISPNTGDSWLLEEDYVVIIVILHFFLLYWTEPHLALDGLIKNFANKFYLKVNKTTSALW